MKINITTAPPKGFKPVTLTLTFETQEELDAYGTMMNFCPIGDGLRAMGGKPVDYQALKDVGAHIHRTADFEKGMMGNGYMSIHYTKNPVKY